MSDPPRKRIFSPQFGTRGASLLTARPRPRGLAAQTSPAWPAHVYSPLARSVTTLPSYWIKRKTLRPRLGRISVSDESHGGHGPCAGYGAQVHLSISLRRYSWI